MLEWSLNSKKKYIYFYFGMVNALRIRVWILKRIEIIYLGGWRDIYSPWTLSYYLNEWVGVSFPLNFYLPQH